MSNIISDEDARLSMIRELLTDFGSADTASKFPIAVESMDDAALVRISDTESLVIASDFIRGSGFYLFEMGHLNYFDVGYYLIVANVSDIAAMGAKPVGLTTVVRYTKTMTDAQFLQVFQGMKSASEALNVQIIGGDTGGYHADVFAATAFGFVQTAKALRRKTVGASDLVCVTGTIGLPITALTYFKEVKPRGFSFSDKEEEYLLNSWKRPSAKVREGLLLSEYGLASACQDVSDGVKATIEQISAISGKTFTIYADKLPVDALTKRMATFLDVDVAQIAISASVDFQLLFTLPRDREKLCSDTFRENGLDYHVIGEVNDVQENCLVDLHGNRGALPGTAWRHQSGDFLKEITKGSA